jgi:aspartate aminotransferase-like enzyme
MTFLTGLLSAIGVPVAKWLLVNLGAFFSKGWKKWLAELALKKKIREAKKEDRAKIDEIMNRLEKAETADEFKKVTSDLANHF